jgi:hypothetical protein
MPDAVIYKPCGNRRATVCSHCSKVYQRDAYQIVRSLLVGGKGVPETVSQHPAVFPTLACRRRVVLHPKCPAYQYRRTPEDRPAAER